MKNYPNAFDYYNKIYILLKTNMKSIFEEMVLHRVSYVNLKLAYSYSIQHPSKEIWHFCHMLSPPVNARNLRSYTCRMWRQTTHLAISRIWDYVFVENNGHYSLAEKKPKQILFSMKVSCGWWPVYLSLNLSLELLYFQCSWKEICEWVNK